MPDRALTLFDADNHYWEASDAFTRYRDSAFADRGVQVTDVDGSLRYVLDGKVFQGLPGPADVHPRPKPGAFMDYFSGKLSRQEFAASFTVPPAEHPEWFEPDPRLRVMDEQGVEATWLFPSQGVVLEAPVLERDIEAAAEMCRAFNRWIEDQWGFAYQDRIFGVPYLNMSDPDELVAELGGVSTTERVVAIRHGSAVTAHGLRSPADTMFDGFWGLAQEANVVVSSHDGADSTYAEMYPLLTRVWGDSPSLGAHAAGDNMRMMGGGSVIGSLMKNRIVHDFAYMLVAHRLFERFPRLFRVAYIENGSAWVPSLLTALEYLGHGGDYQSNPKDQFIEHCWVAPFVEESVDELARHLPVERILFGSDWPHGEGFPRQPRDFLDNVANFSAEDRQRIMYQNAHDLTFS